MTMLRNLAKIILKRYPRDLYWQLRGPFLVNNNISSRINKIHFVCKGNICRSAFAHVLGEKLLHNAGKNKCEVSSSGLKVLKSEKPPAEAIKIANKHFGVSLANHRSIPLTLELCEKMDIILVMEGWQLQFIYRFFPPLKEKSFLLSQFEEGLKRYHVGYDRYNIADPYGKGEDAFLECFDRITRCINGLLSLV